MKKLPAKTILGGKHAVIKDLVYDQEDFNSYPTQAQITYLITALFWLSFLILKMDLIVPLYITEVM